jgi:hypothetical protein
MGVQIAALALASCFALGLLIFDEPERRRAEIADQQALAACTRVYDGAACDCALRASVGRFPSDARQGGARFVASSSPSIPVGTEPVTLRIGDFVHLVQACMARGADPLLD